MKTVKACLLSVCAVLVFLLAGCGSSDKEKEKIVGTWKQDRVLASEAGGEMTERSRENAASLYESEQSNYTFSADGKLIHHVEDGGGSFDTEGTWTLSAKDTYAITEGDSITDTLTYDSSDDTLHRHWKSANSDDMYTEIDFVYIRK